jgi:Spy/CpxP family protein refolding chaperone
VRDVTGHAMRHARRCLAAASFVFLAAAPAPPAAAQMPEAPPGKWWKRPRIVQLLGLTAEQQTKLEDIFSRRRREFVDLKADVERRQIDVEELVAKKDTDPRKISTAVDALEQSRLKLRKTATMMFLEQRDVLSAAQWQQVLDRREEWRAQRLMERRGAAGGEHSPGGGAGLGAGRERSQQRPPDQRPTDQRPPDREPQGAGVPRAFGDPPRLRAAASAKSARSPGRARKTAYGMREPPA